MWKRIALAGLGLIGIVGMTTVVTIGVPRSVRVPTAAMANTILPGDHILCSSRLGTIRRGDIIVFRYPKDPRELYVKRVVALPGETVQLIGTQVVVNGKPIPERQVDARWISSDAPLKERATSGDGPYTVYYDLQNVSHEPGPHNGNFGVSAPYTVPNATCFVLGDNRDNSEDSRYWGPVPLANIVARPLFVYSSQVGDSTRLFKRLT